MTPPFPLENQDRPCGENRQQRRQPGIGNPVVDRAGSRLGQGYRVKRQPIVSGEPFEVEQVDHWQPLRMVQLEHTTVPINRVERCFGRNQALGADTVLLSAE